MIIAFRRGKRRERNHVHLFKRDGRRKRKGKKRRRKKYFGVGVDAMRILLTLQTRSDETVN